MRWTKRKKKEKNKEVEKKIIWYTCRMKEEEEKPGDVDVLYIYLLSCVHFTSILIRHLHALVCMNVVIWACQIKPLFVLKQRPWNWIWNAPIVWVISFTATDRQACVQTLISSIRKHEPRGIYVQYVQIGWITGRLVSVCLHSDLITIVRLWILIGRELRSLSMRFRSAGSFSVIMTTWQHVKQMFEEFPIKGPHV